MCGERRLCSVWRTEKGMHKEGVSKRCFRLHIQHVCYQNSYTTVFQGYSATFINENSAENNTEETEDSVMSATCESEADKTSLYFFIYIHLLLGEHTLWSVTVHMWRRSGWFVLHLRLMIFSQRHSWGKIWADSSHTHSSSGESFYVAVWVSVNPNRCRLPAAGTVQSLVPQRNGEKNCCRIRGIPFCQQVFYLCVQLFLLFFSLLMMACLCMMLSSPRYNFDLNRLMKYC